MGLALQGRKVVLAGWSQGWAVARLTRTGAYDTMFGSGGIATPDVPGLPRGVEVRRGKLMTIGWTWDGGISGSTLVRLLG